MARELDGKTWYSTDEYTDDFYPKVDPVTNRSTTVYLMTYNGIVYRGYYDSKAMNFLIEDGEDINALWWRPLE